MTNGGAVEDNPELRKLEVNTGTILRIIRLGFEHPWLVSVTIFSIVCAVGFQLWIPSILGSAVDNSIALITGGASSEAEARRALLMTGLLLIGVSVLRGTFAMIHTTLAEAIAQKVAYRLRMGFYEKLQRLSFSYHDRSHVGDQMTLGILDLEAVRQFYQEGFFRTIFITLLLIIGAAMLLSIDWRLGLIGLSFVPFAAWRAIVTRIKLRKMWDDLQSRFSNLTRVMQENLGGIRVVRAFSAQNHEIAKFEVVSDDILNRINHAVQIRVRNDTAMRYSFYISYAALFMAGGLMVMSGEITVGQLASYMVFMGLLMNPVRQLGMTVNSFARASTSGTRLFATLDLDPEIRDRQGARELEIKSRVLRFENVSFSFPDARFLEDINFEARPGHTIGIVGPPGSGKSTIAHLIPRFYEVTSGRITIDGQDIREVTLDSLRRHVAVVQQDTFMFTSTIFENVAYGDPSAPQVTVEDATARTQIHEYIRRLPESYDTIVGERGVSLSGGQRQRMSIARSVMLNPDVLVFDDSTAAIDAATENRIRAALRDMMKTSTVIVISHRLSSLMHLDEILFIDKGRIIERGTHEALIALGGRYRDLYELQIKPAQELRATFPSSSLAGNGTGREGKAGGA